MWRSVTGESGSSASPAPGPELTSPGFHTYDSPLLGLLSAVSRPAVSLLQRYLPGPRAGKRDFLERDGDFLPPQQLHSLPWFNLEELGIQSPEAGGPPSRGSGALWSGPWSGPWGCVERGQCSSVGLFFQERSERAGAAGHKGAPGLPQLKLIQSLGVCGDMSVLTPDQDHGYCSLEEEQLLGARARLQVQSTLPGMENTEEHEEPEEPEEEPEEPEEEPEEPEEEPEEPEEEPEEPEELPVLKCDNKTIAFIMGCPCSDESESNESDEDESEEEDEDEDDGFDSVCSSSESEDEFDSEAERLWSSLCQNHDPYNPRNFTAALGSAPRPIPGPGPGAGAGPEEQSSPGSSVGSSASSSSSWDEASESEEQENLKLLGSFCSSDPYSPLNFQAPIRTKPRPETKPDPEPEQNRVRKISECSPSSSRASGKKKVRFCSELQVFSVGSEERRGPWEELARDRARFLKRCSDVERVLSACLQQEHRGRVYQRISQSERGAEPEEGGTSPSEQWDGQEKQPIRG